MMGALLKPTGGTIQMQSQTISALAEQRLPTIRLHRIGFVFQGFNLLSALSVQDNVALVAELAGMKHRAARGKAAALLTQLGLGTACGSCRSNSLGERSSGLLLRVPW
jgi:putative ABC transport system ATP-binding protein